MSRKHRAKEAKRKDGAEVEPLLKPPNEGKPERHPQDLPAGPVDRGGSLLPCAGSIEQVDEAIDESFPASDPPSWSPSRAA